MRNQRQTLATVIGLVLTLFVLALQLQGQAVNGTLVAEGSFES